MLRAALRLLLGAAMIAVGVLHFTSTEFFMAIVPRGLSTPRAIVWVTGFFEIAGGVGLLLPWTRRAAAIGLLALYVAVFPANVNMAVNHIQPGAEPVPVWAMWARLPLQGVILAWAVYAGGPGLLRRRRTVAGAHGPRTR